MKQIEIAVLKDVVLNSQEREHLVFTIETSLKISKRFQFFLWAQGALQGFLPHETLLCAYGDFARMRFKYETFSRAALDAGIEREIGEPVNGLLPHLIGDWLRHGRIPRSYGAGEGGPAGERPLLAELRRHDFGHAAAHGAREVQGEFGSFFAFLRRPEAPTARDAHFLELLMPYLHMALHRMLANESSEAAAEVSAGPVLSEREIQVLNWVKDGKTNQEIGRILGISHLTVKNHVQNILRKLKVSNRAQAVAKGAASRLFPSGEST